MESLKTTLELSEKLSLAYQNMLKGFSTEQLNKIPEGYKNNLIWNIAHTIATQQILVYKQSQLNPIIPNEFILQFQKDTKPEKDLSAQEIEDIGELLVHVEQTTKKDLQDGIFRRYATYTTGVGLKLTSVEAAAEFSNFHCGVHLGIMMRMKHLL